MNDSVIYKTPYRNVIINLRSNERAIMSFSGGADSVILLYILALHKRIPEKVVFVGDVVGTESNLKWQTAVNCVKWIDEKCGTDLLSITEFAFMEYTKASQTNIGELFQSYEVVFNGITQNPLVDDFPFPKELTPIRPPSAHVYKFARYEAPFGTFDKRATIYLYDLLGVNELLELTRSCPERFGPVCGKCFHCVERKWAIKEVSKVKKV